MGKFVNEESVEGIIFEVFSDDVYWLKFSILMIGSCATRIILIENEDFLVRVFNGIDCDDV